MIKFREIIRLHELGYNQSEIAESCAVARSTVQDYIRRAEGKGLSYAQLGELSDSEVQARLGKGQKETVEKTVIDFTAVHRELQPTFRRLLLVSGYASDFRSLEPLKSR